MKFLSLTALTFFVAMPIGGNAQTAPVLPQPASAEASPLHPWQAPLRNTPTDAYFVNLEDGAKIETPFRVEFGLGGGWGLAPISSEANGKSGHHHLLVNRDLPLDFKQSLPFNDQYIHFGKGQMETVLTLEPGTYTLRLLLADNKHVPHFVYSKPVHITVTRKNKNRPKEPYQKKHFFAKCVCRCQTECSV